MCAVVNGCEEEVISNCTSRIFGVDSAGRIRNSLQQKFHSVPGNLSVPFAQFDLSTPIAEFRMFLLIRKLPCTEQDLVLQPQTPRYRQGWNAKAAESTRCRLGIWFQITLARLDMKLFEEVVLGHQALTLKQATPSWCGFSGRWQG